MKSYPSDYSVELNTGVCSNFDHEVDQNVVNRIKSEPLVVMYPAWDWHGLAWFDKEINKFCLRVNIHGAHVATLEADTFEEIKEAACSQFGND